jgi:hypothetical protein
MTAPDHRRIRSKDLLHRWGHPHMTHWSVFRGRESRWWLLPANLNDVTNEALAVAVEQGWMVMDHGHSVCLTDVGRDLARAEKRP